LRGVEIVNAERKANGCLSEAVANLSKFGEVDDNQDVINRKTGKSEKGESEDAPDIEMNDTDGGCKEGEGKMSITDNSTDKDKEAGDQRDSNEEQQTSSNDTSEEKQPAIENAPDIEMNDTDEGCKEGDGQVSTTDNSTDKDKEAGGQRDSNKMQQTSSNDTSEEKQPAIENVPDIEMNDTDGGCKEGEGKMSITDNSTDKDKEEGGQRDSNDTSEEKQPAIENAPDIEMNDTDEGCKEGDGQVSTTDNSTDKDKEAGGQRDSNKMQQTSSNDTSEEKQQAIENAPDIEMNDTDGGCKEGEGKMSITDNSTDKDKEAGDQRDSNKMQQTSSNDTSEEKQQAIENAPDIEMNDTDGGCKEGEGKMSITDNSTDKDKEAGDQRDSNKMQQTSSNDTSEEKQPAIENAPDIEMKDTDGGCNEEGGQVSTTDNSTDKDKEAGGQRDSNKMQQTSANDTSEEKHRETVEDESCNDNDVETEKASAGPSEDNDDTASAKERVDTKCDDEQISSISTFLKKSSTANSTTSNIHPITSVGEEYAAIDDVKNMWTVEEDLRLLDAIAHLGLGNWMDISEEVAGTSGTASKTPKKCMERYLYDYLGRYGPILPQYTLVEAPEVEYKSVEVGDCETAEDGTVVIDKDSLDKKQMRSGLDPISRQDSSLSLAFTGMANKEYTVVVTETLPGYEEVWPKPYLPPLENTKMGDDVGRDLAVKAELSYVKAIGAATSDSEADSIRKEWENTRLNLHGGPTVLPPRPEDVSAMHGHDLAGFMPRRGDFDIEWDNDAEKLLEDMEFLANDTAEDRALKVKVLAIYNSRLDTREQRKKFLVDRGLLDYRKHHQEQNKLPADERDLKNRMRLFARFQSPEKHDELVQDILKAKRLRKEIARLQMYRRMGFTSMVDAERFELDRNRREAHRLACEQREKEEKIAADTVNELGTNSALSTSEVKATYLKQYKLNDRNKRNSLDNDTLFDVETSTEGVCSRTDGTDMQVDTSNAIHTSANISPVKGAKPQFDVRKCPGYEILTKKELELCQKLELQPKLYTEAKTVLIHESLKQGFLDQDSTHRRSLFKVDVEKRGDVINFILKSGWLPDLPKSLKSGWLPGGSNSLV
jgi:transcriptional adapter 2-alpha